ncbi:MAG: alcohol dehydrogenase catalytic domain-containing protein [Candidatus Latescibacterota bacterium]
MKAAVLRAIGQPLQVEEIPEPEVGPDEVLVRTHTCGICRTDLHIQDGLAYVPALPHVPGHEPAGVVVATGSRVTAVEPGQRVVPHLFVTCGHCRYCRSGRDAQCTNLDGIIGVTRAGGFAEYFTAPARNLIPIPDGVDDDAAGLMSCAVITAVHAYRRARLAVGDTAVVIGAGGIGLIMIQLLKSAGVRVIALSRSPLSRDLATQHGADAALPLGDEDSVSRLKDLSGGEGADCIFDMVGLAGTMATAADCAARGGRIVVIGEEAEYPAVDTIAIAQRELEIIGSRNGGFQDAVDALAFMKEGIIRPWIDRRFPLAEINEALNYVRSGRSHGRVIVTVDE